MGTNNPGWQASTPAEADSATLKMAARQRGRKPIATITLMIYSDQPGDSTLKLEVAPDGEFAAVAGTSAKMSGVIQQELTRGLGALGQIG
jgi:hypothetical protein